MVKYSNADVYRLLETMGKPMKAAEIYESLGLPPADQYEMAMLCARLRGMAKRAKVVATLIDGKRAYEFRPNKSCV